MAEQKYRINGGFFNSVGNDRTYTADDMNRPYKRVITEGIFATPQGTPSTDLKVQSANNAMNIIVKAGEGLLGGRWFESPSDIVITVPANNGVNPRRDSVIIQIDNRQSGRVPNIIYREGTPSSNPQVPDLSTNSNVVEKRVANVYVAAGASNINNDAITDLRGSSEIAWITSLINQVDTSTLYDQYRAAYDAYYQRETELFNHFMETLTSELSVNTNIIKYESHYKSVNDGETVIPINISSYNKNRDILIVRINRLYATEGIDFTITSNSSITLTKDICANQNVDFLVLQSVVINAEAGTIIESVQGLSTAVTNLSTDVNALKADGGWINFSLEGGATAYDDNNKPGVRKFGNLVNLRGAIKGVTATGTTICTLPAAYKPAMDYYFTSSAIASGSVKSTVTFQVLASNGTVKLVAKSGTIAATDLISIATNFIVG